MSSKQEIKQEFEQILSTSDWWKRFIGSQFVDGLSNFIAQVVDRVNNTSARRLQDSFLSQATRRASILAAAEDRAHIPLKISPSTGTVKITNNTDTRISVPAMTPLISKDLVDYVITRSIDIGPLQSVSVEISQLWLERISTTVTQSVPWISVLLPQDLTAKTHKVDVYVNGQLWEKRYKFRNTTPDSKAYMEYYKPTEQLGIRFGNGINGRIPEEGSDIILNVWCTDGETVLLDGQKMQFVDEFERLNKSLSVVTETSITGGAQGDDIEAIRNGALYTTAYDNQIAWDSDYRQFIKLQVGGLVWLSVWGEKQQEALTGKKDLRNINKIFISAYSDVKDDEKLSKEIIALFDGREGYNEIYEWVTHKEMPFTINVSGKVHPNAKPEDAEIQIRELLSSLYGKNTRNKPHRILIKDIWAAINSHTSSLGITEFEVVANNLPNEIPVDTYSFLDTGSSTISFSFESTTL